MVRLTLAVLLLVVAASQAKTRRRFLPESVAQQRRFWFDVDEKIVGGQEVTPGDIPYIISFQDKSSGNFHFCGGSIVAKTWVVTAAHCVAGEDFNPTTPTLRVVAGEHHRTTVEGNEQHRDVTKIIQHESYNSATISNDVAMLRLDSELDWTDFVMPIAIPEHGQDSAGDSQISGWGTLGSGGSSPQVLHTVIVPIISDDECRAQYGTDAIFDSMICAGRPEGGVDSCQGDSGGPMVCSNADGEYLCGIVSWGRGCALPGYAGVYTEVSHFVDWACQNLGC
jgi:trypsin